MKLFKEKGVSYYFLDQYQKITSDIENMNEDKFMDIDPKELSNNKVAFSQLNHLSFDFSNRKVQTVMIDVLGSKHPGGWDVEPDEKYKRLRVSYIYDLPKDSELLSYEPTNYVFPVEVSAKIDNEKLILDYQTFYGEELSGEERKEVKEWITTVENEIIQVVTNINLDIDMHNESMNTKIFELVTNRHNAILRGRDQNNDLNN